MKKIMEKLLVELGNTSITYWTNPKASFSSITALLTSSAILLTLDRIPTSGFQTDTTTHLFLIILSFAFQLIACLAPLIRGGNGSAAEEAMKFFRLLVVVWIISLILFLHNFAPPLRVADFFHPWIMAAIYSVIAVGLMVNYTVRKERRKDPGKPLDYSGIAFWSLVVGALNTVFFFLFILDTGFTGFILEKKDQLLHLFPR